MILLKWFIKYKQNVVKHNSINWFVFDYILLILYKTTQHNGDVSPESSNGCL